MQNKYEKPDIAIDIDGVILNFVKGFSGYWNSIFPDDKISDNPDSWYFSHPEPEKINKYISLYYDMEPMFELMEKYIPKHLKKLSKFYKINLVTSFPTEYKDLRHKQLDYHDIYYDEIYFVGKDKAEMITIIDPWAVIEDCPDNIQKIVNMILPTDTVIFVPYHWNYTKNISHPNVIHYKKFEDVVYALTC